MPETPRRLRPDDMLTLPDRGKGWELIDGRPVERRASLESSWISGQIFHRLSRFGDETYSLWSQTQTELGIQPSQDHG
jgi:hypothetical protein